MIELSTTPAPMSPLNLCERVIYAPRVPTPPYLAYEAIETASDEWLIRAYDAGGPVDIYRGPLAAAYRRLAICLRMDVAP